LCFYLLSSFSAGAKNKQPLTEARITKSTPNG
jgi:hypothetical protein